MKAFARMFGLKVQIVVDIFIFFFPFPKTSGITCLYYYRHWQHLFDFVGMTIVIGLI